MTQPGLGDAAQRLLDQQQRLLREVKELELLIESTQTEVNRLRARQEQIQSRVEDMRRNPANYQREEIFGAYAEHTQAVERRVLMEGQLAALQSKRTLLERLRSLVADAAATAQEAQATPAVPAAERVVDEGRLLRAIVDTQEEERRRIARQVHDGPAQTLSNVVLQAEISERLFEADPQRARQELAALRELVNRTLQELRGFIFELRPMILDDLGLVPTMRRYVQTLVDKHGVRIDYSSTGRDRRLPPDDEVAIFRLIQDSVIERIERGQAKVLQLVLNWQDEVLDAALLTDGRELPGNTELTSGLRRSERLGLLRAEAKQETRQDGTLLLTVRIPLRPVAAVS